MKLNIPHITFKRDPNPKGSHPNAIQMSPNNSCPEPNMALSKEYTSIMLKIPT